MPTKVLHCYAEGRDGDWEAICLDFDIAVQGRSFDEVADLLREAVSLYLESLADLPAGDRERLLQRQAPLRVRLKFLLGAARDLFAGTRSETEHYQFTMPVTA